MEDPLPEPEIDFDKIIETEAGTRRIEKDDLKRFEKEYALILKKFFSEIR
jgi:hypothetical protein